MNQMKKASEKRSHVTNENTAIIIIMNMYGVSVKGLKVNRFILVMFLFAFAN